MAKGFFELIPCRIIFGILGALGMVITHGLKDNLRIAFFGMINYVELANSTGDIPIALCPDHGNEKFVFTDGPFVWSTNLQEIIFSSYYLGCLFSIFPGALLSENVSAKWTMFAAILINIICTAITPFSANLHYIMLIATRIMAGIGGGLTFPAMHVLLSKWSPPRERTVMCSAVYSATVLGTGLANIFTYFIEKGLDWKWVFYIMAAASTLWLPLWIGLIYDMPDKSPVITEQERALINDAVGDVYPNSKFPAKSIFTSTPFWALLIAHTCISWVWYTVVIVWYLYSKSRHQKRIAVESGIVFVTVWLAGLIFGVVVNREIQKEKKTITNARKDGIVWCSTVSGICLVVLCFSGCIILLIEIMITISIVFMNTMFCGIYPNHIDLAPNHAGILIACTNFAATLPAIILPIFVGALMEIDTGMFSWRIIYLFGTALGILAICVYILFGSGEQQPWNDE